METLTITVSFDNPVVLLLQGMQENIDREYMNALAEAADDGAISDADFKRMHGGNVSSVEALDSPTGKGLFGLTPLDSYHNVFLVRGRPSKTCCTP